MKADTYLYNIIRFQFFSVQNDSFKYYYVFEKYLFAFLLKVLLDLYLITKQNVRKNYIFHYILF